MKIIHYIFIFLLFLAWLPLSVTHASQLRIEVLRPDTSKLMNQNDTAYILMNGVIDIGAPKRLEAILKNSDNHYADVYLNSPGGNLLAGMELGKLLRNSGANTFIGTGRIENRPTFNNLPFFRSSPGLCLSACSLTFLGGVYRYGMDNSQYGVHRFYSSTGSSPDDLSLGQMLSAVIGAYIREMGVSNELFDHMVKAGRDEMLVLSSSELTRLNVYNNGRQRAQWSIEAVEGGQYLRGEQTTVYGNGKLVFMCGTKNVAMVSFYHSGEERANQIKSGNWVHSIMTSTETIPIAAPSAARVVDGVIEQVFSLNPQQVRKLSQSKSIGHAMQLSREAPTFVGFQIDIQESKDFDRVKNFLLNCIS